MGVWLNRPSHRVVLCRGCYVLARQRAWRLTRASQSALAVGLPRPQQQNEVLGLDERSYPLTPEKYGRGSGNNLQFTSRLSSKVSGMRSAPPSLVDTLYGDAYRFMVQLSFAVLLYSIRSRNTLHEVDHQRSKMSETGIDGTMDRTLNSICRAKEQWLSIERLFEPDVHLLYGYLDIDPVFR